MIMDFVHKPVLLSETIDALCIKPDGVYVDGTIGGGGHSLHIAERLSAAGRLIGIDQDEAACVAAGERLSAYSDRVTIVRDNFRNFREVLDEQNIEKADGILLDLGVSSYQLDTAERGFSYMKDAPLDMRMDQRESMTAADIVNTYTEEELAHILREFGEERFAGRIAHRIVTVRETAPIRTTGELAAIVEKAVPAAGGGHPAKRTFQALRIELNGELRVLSDSLDGMIDVLAEGGRLAVITFHSLEDRIVKNVFRTAEKPCICPPDFPVCVCGRKSKGINITRKPVLPGKEELADNRRAASAKLRVF